MNLRKSCLAILLAVQNCIPEIYAGDCSLTSAPTLTWDNTPE